VKPLHASIIVALPLIALLGYMLTIWHDPNWAPSGIEVQGLIILLAILCLNITIIFSLFYLVKNQLTKNGQFTLSSFIFLIFIASEIIALLALLLLSVFYLPSPDIYFYIIPPLMVSIPSILFAAIWWFLVYKLKNLSSKKAS
jgi:hypothetical protein